jgi:L-alanine-DL-glutamate epimerase-like enolase superfamily enzyme
MGNEARVKIERLQAIPLAYPTVGRFKFFEDALGRAVGRQAVLVKITADDGSIGHGQSVPINRWSCETIHTVVSTIERYLAPVLVGMDVFDRQAIGAAMDAAIAPGFATGQPICKAGIDLALFDLTGRLLGQNAARRWGRTGRERITLSWTINPLKLDDVPALIDAGRQRGYRNFNIKVAPDPAFDVQLCRLVRQLAPDTFLWADANGGYDLATALQVIPKLRDAGCDVLEQPLRPHQIRGYQRIRKLAALPIYMDEGIIDAELLEEYIALGMLDGVAMKPARCGGLTSARRQIELLEKHGLGFLGSGLTDPDLSLAASLLLYSAYGLQHPAALNGPQFLQDSILKAPFEVKDGTLAPPSGPGLGVEVDPEKVERLRVRL